MSTPYKIALDAINNLFGDTSVDQEETLADLNALADDICEKTEAIEADLYGND